jgi:hypothetical protein
MFANKAGTVLDLGSQFGASGDDEVDSFKHLVIKVELEGGRVFQPLNWRWPYL